MRLKRPFPKSLGRCGNILDRVKRSSGDRAKLHSENHQSHGQVHFCYLIREGFTIKTIT